MSNCCDKKEKESERSPCCCSGNSASAESAGAEEVTVPDAGQGSWIDGSIDTAIGSVPQLSRRWTRAETWGRIRMRLDIGRMDYRVEPGLYALGSPDGESPVLVTANYKYTLDVLRSSIPEVSAWVLVLDTKGVNVWCAAGKGAFGTEELVWRIRKSGLERVVSHREVILPQLGAVGVAAHEVSRQSGFRVIYGPVQARDIGAFLSAGKEATPAMRRINFTFHERLEVVPVELLQWFKYLLPVLLLLALVGGVNSGGFVPGQILAEGLGMLLAVLAGYVGGTFLAAALLPFFSGHTFSLAGAVGGLAVGGFMASAGLLPTANVVDNYAIPAALLLMAAVASFSFMNITGNSTYAGSSGVRQEMRLCVPLQAGAAFVGAALWVWSQFA